jgi:hypothetical protein
VIINHNGGVAAPLSMLKHEVATVPGRETRIVALPCCTRAARWACSGRTAYQDLRRHLRPLTVRSTPASESRAEGAAQGLLARLFRRWRESAVEDGDRGAVDRRGQNLVFDKSVRSLSAAAPVNGFLGG